MSRAAPLSGGQALGALSAAAQPSSGGSRATSSGDRSLTSAVLATRAFETSGVGAHPQQNLVISASGSSFTTARRNGERSPLQQPSPQHQQQQA
eukprot:3553006-Alexandrium_andersonii.AAC.1